MIPAPLACLTRYARSVAGGFAPPDPPTPLLDRREPLHPGWLAPLRGRDRPLHSARARAAPWPAIATPSFTVAKAAARVAHSLPPLAARAVSRAARPLSSSTLNTATLRSTFLIRP